MALGLGWKLKGDGRSLGPDEVVAPDERLSWGKTAGLGAQHVVAMFGATFVFPLVMGLKPQLAIMMSGVATIAFLGSAVLHKVLPPVVTGAVVMLIGFNLAPVVAGIYWPQDQWVALATMT